MGRKSMWKPPHERRKSNPVGYHGPVVPTSYHDAPKKAKRTRDHTPASDLDKAWMNRSLAAEHGARTVTATDIIRQGVEAKKPSTRSIMGHGPQGAAERIKALMRNIYDIKRKLSAKPNDPTLLALLAKQTVKLDFITAVQAKLIEDRLDAREDRLRREEQKGLVTVTPDGKRERFIPAKAGMVRHPLKMERE